MNEMSRIKKIFFTPLPEKNDTRKKNEVSSNNKKVFASKMHRWWKNVDSLAALILKYFVFVIKKCKL